MTEYQSLFEVRIATYDDIPDILKITKLVVDRIMLKKGVKKICLHTGSKVTSLIRFYYGRGFYIDSTDKSKGYVRALLIKDYE